MMFFRFYCCYCDDHYDDDSITLVIISKLECSILSAHERYITMPSSNLHLF
jgi:hypothetical protein